MRKRNYYHLFVLGFLGLLSFIVTIANLGFKGAFVGYDAGVTLQFPEKELKFVYNLWNESIAPGKPYLLATQSFIWFNFLALLNKIVLSPIILQRIVYFLAIFISGFSAYYLTRTVLRLIFPKATSSPYLYFASLAAGIIYMFNYYTMFLFSQPTLNYQFIYFLLPLALAKIIEITELELSKFRYVFGLSLILIIIFSANIGSITVFLSVVFLYLIFYIFSKRFRIKYLFKPIYFKIALLVVLLTSYIWLPNLLFGENPWAYTQLLSDSEGSLTEIFKQDFLSSAKFNSRISSFLNLFRLSGLMIWPSSPYYKFFRDNSGLIILSFLLPLVLLAGLTTAFYKKMQRKHILIFFLFLLPIFLFLSKGLHEPFSGAYLKIYQLVPYFEMFKASYLKFTPVVIMSYSLFLGIFTYLFFVFLFRKFKKARVWSFILFFLFLVAILAHNWPFFLGKIVRKGDLCIIPQEDYDKVNDYVKQHGEGKVFTLPPLGGKSASWGKNGEDGDYAGFDRDPIIFDKPILSSLWFIQNSFIAQLDAFNGFHLEESLPKIINTFDLFNVRYILLHKDSFRTRDYGAGGGFKNYQREKRNNIIKGILAKEDFVKLALETDNLALYRVDDSVFGKRIYVPEKTYFIEGGIGDLFYTYPFEKATEGRMVIFSSFKDRNNVFSLDKVDEIFVKGELKDAIGEEELYLAPIEAGALPHVRWRPDHFVYPLVLKKEEYDKWRVRNDPRKLFEKYLFYASKRISEMVEYAPMIAGTEYSASTREKYKKEMGEAVEILEDLRIWHDKDFPKLRANFKGTIWGHQEEIEEIGELGNWEILFRELEKKVDELKVERDFSKFVYKLEVSKEGEYELFMKYNDEWTSLGERDFEKGAQALVLPIEGISGNLVDENLKINDYTPDSIYKISFDYQAPHGGSFFIAEGKAGETAETNLFPTGAKFRHFEMFFRSSPEAEQASVHLSISIAGERDLRVERIYQPKLFLRYEIGDRRHEIPKITFIKINPTKYKVKVEGAKEPYTLIFSESFHKGWKAYINRSGEWGVGSEESYGEIVASYFDGEIKEGTHKNIFLDRDTFETWGKKPISEERHLLVNGYANSWYITPEDANGAEDYEIIIEFWPQRLFYVGLFISSIALIGCLFYLTYDIVKNKKVARNS